MTVVLGFDTATHATVVGLRLAADETLQARDDPAADGHPGHATRLLAMAADLLAQAKLRWSAVERIAVGVGPGRFTGLRVGLATARGLAQSLDAELVGVSTLRTLGLGARRSSTGGGADRATIAVVDARRGEVFAAAYPGAGADEIAFEHALSRSELERVVDEVERRGGPAGERWQAVGDGALAYQSELRAAGVIVPPADSPLHLLDAAALCDLGAEAVAASALEALLPDYRRAPDAALARGRALAAAARGVYACATSSNRRWAESLTPRRCGSVRSPIQTSRRCSRSSAGCSRRRGRWRCSCSSCPSRRASAWRQPSRSPRLPVPRPARPSDSSAT